QLQDYKQKTVNKFQDDTVFCDYSVLFSGDIFFLIRLFAASYLPDSPSSAPLLRFFNTELLRNPKGHSPAILVEKE
ncbi:MAG: hypothetical protein WCL70_13950, partial [Paludibacter sp.]